jgi:predicted esterase
VIGVEWGREARDRMTEAGASVTYQESPMAHAVDPAFISRLAAWLGEVV